MPDIFSDKTSNIKQEKLEKTHCSSGRIMFVGRLETE
jgi:hypothetical protein